MALFNMIEANEKLSANFAVEMPTVINTDRAKRGRYSPRRKAIIVGGNCWRGVEAAFIHEFAHYLQHMRGHRMGHGPDFKAILREVVKAWYVHEAKYPWRTEYKHVRSWYSTTRRAEAFAAGPKES